MSRRTETERASSRARGPKQAALTAVGTGRPRPRVAAVGAVLRLAPLALLPAAGCADLFRSHEHLGFEVPLQELYEIDAFDPGEAAAGPGTTVDEAAEQALDEVTRGPGAGETLELTLEEVRAAALANNLDLEVQLISPSIAATAVSEERARFEATFTASARRTHTDAPTATPQIEGTQVTVESFDVGVEIPLRTGGTINVNMPFSETETNFPALVNPSFAADLQFSISQPLLRNAGPEVNLHALRVARGEQMITTSQTKLEAIRILANADRAYWALYAAAELLVVRQREYELAVEQLETARNRVETGDAAEIEVVRAQSGVADTLDLIIRAESAVRRRQRDLKRIMNRPELPIGSVTRLLPRTEPNPVWYDLDADRLAGLAVANRMEMLELELRLAIDASQVDFDRNQALPLFVLDYTYNPGGLGPTYQEAFDDLPPRSFESWTVGARAEIPLGNEAARSRLHRAILTRLQRLATKRQRDLAIRQEVLDALDDLEDSWQRILAARLAARLAGRTFEAEQRQFDVGLRTSTDVLDAAARLADAQSQEVRALADYEDAMVNLAFATGTLLGQARVQWEPIEQ